MSTKEMKRWRKYYDLEPFGFPRFEARFASIMTALFAASPAKVDKKEYLSADFWKYKPPITGPLKIQSADSVFATFKSQFGSS